MKVFEEVFLIQYLTVPTTSTERPITDIVCFDPKLIIRALLCVGKNVVGVEDETATQAPRWTSCPGVHDLGRA